MNISININGDDCQAAPVELSASFVREFVKEEWPDEDYPSLTIMQSEHGKGLNPTIQIVEYVGEDQLKVKQLNDSEVKYVYINLTGDIKIILGNQEVKFKGRAIIS